MDFIWCGGKSSAKPDRKTPDMALTVHVDIVKKKSGLAISRIFFLVTTPWLIIQLLKKKGQKMIKKKLNEQHSSKDTE